MATSKSNEPDIFELSNAYFIGNYQQCINSALKLVSPDIARVRDVFMYRSYIAQGKFRTALEEIPDRGNDLTLASIRLMAEYLSSNTEQDKSKVLNSVDSLLVVGASESDGDVPLVVLAGIYLHEHNTDSSIRTLNTCYSLEAMSLRVQIYLAMDRLDLAKSEVKSMIDKDDDSTLTQLAQAWFCLAVGGEKIQEAFFIYQELMDKNSPTALLLNGQACCHMLQEKWDEAESLLQDSLDRDNNNPDTLLNLYVTSQQLGKSNEICKRFLRQLEEIQPSYCFLRDFKKREQEFYEASQQLSI